MLAGGLCGRAVHTSFIHISQAAQAACKHADGKSSQTQAALVFSRSRVSLKRQTGCAVSRAAPPPLQPPR